jgi:hypothetical protein
VAALFFQSRQPCGLRQALPKEEGKMNILKERKIQILALAVAVGVTTGVIGAKQSKKITPDAPKTSVAETSASLENGSTAAMTKEDFDRIFKLDFPECKKLLNQKEVEKQCKLEVDYGYENCKARELFVQCSTRLQQEAYKMFELKDPQYLPELITLAKLKRFSSSKIKTPPGPTLALPCALRYSAINTLGRLKDPRAIDTLIELMNEQPTQDTNCNVYWDSDQDGFCDQASAALRQLNPQGISEQIIKHVNKNASFIKQNVKSNSNDADPFSNSNMELMSSYLNMTCNIRYLPATGPEGRSFIFEQLSLNNLMDLAIIPYLDAASNYYLTVDEAKTISKYMNDEYSKDIIYKAGCSISNKPVGENKQLYIDIANSGNMCGLTALSTLQAPEGLVIIQDKLNNKDDSSIYQAMSALSNYSSEEIKPFLPSLLKIIESDEYCRKYNPSSDRFYCGASYFPMVEKFPLVKAQDPSVIPDLMKMAYIGNKLSLPIIGHITCVQSQDALKKLIEDNGFMDRSSALYWYLYQTGEAGRPFALKYFDETTVDSLMEKAKKEMQ